MKEISSTVLAYDNMCHVDNLKIARKNLPLPHPYNKLWKCINKVTDRLHLRNHVDQKCHTLYNPDDNIPKTYKTMACEQTFVWASRFKKVMCAMYATCPPILFFTLAQKVQEQICREMPH